MLYFLPFLALYGTFEFLSHRSADPVAKRMGAILLLSALSLVLLFVISAWAFFPDLFGARAPYATVATVAVERLEWYAPELNHALVGAPASAYTPNVSGIPFPLPGSYAPHYWLPALAGLAGITVGGTWLLARRGRRALACYLALALVLSTLLAAGTQGPLGLPYEWAFRNVPFGNLVHIPSRWLIVSQLVFAVVLGLTIATAESKRLRYGLTIGVLALAVAGNLPSLLKGYDVAPLPDQERAAYEHIGQQRGDFRVMTVPFGQEAMLTERYGSIRDWGFESQMIHGQTVLRTGEGMTRSKDVAEYLVSLMGDQQFQRFGQVLAVFDVRYVVDTGRSATQVRGSPGINYSSQRGFICRPSAIMGHVRGVENPRV